MRYLLVTLFLGLFGTACIGECEQLANVICDCDQDPQQRAACRTQITNDVRQIQITAEDNKVCAAKLKVCDNRCQKLALGDREACGFSREK